MCYVQCQDEAFVSRNDILNFYLIEKEMNLKFQMINYFCLLIEIKIIQIMLIFTH